MPIVLIPVSNVAKNKYQLPVPSDKSISIDRNSSHAHWGRLENAVDILAPMYTPVLAAATGTVTYVKDDSDIGGPSIDFWEYSNFISIRHEHDEYTRYDHLAFQSSKVKVGASVTEGQEVGKVGMTGYTYVPHLHFQVFIFTGPNIWEHYRTLEVNF